MQIDILEQFQINTNTNNQQNDNQNYQFNFNTCISFYGTDTRFSNVYRKT